MQDSTVYEDRPSEQVERLTDWANEPTVLTLQDDLKMAQPWHDTHVAKVESWLALRNVEGKARPKTAQNRSKVQPKLVRRQAEWRYPALSEPFLSSEKMFEVSPVTWEDVKGAKQNELVLNHQFRTQLNSVKFIDDYVRTAVDEGTAIVRVGWERETKMVEVEVPVWAYEVEDDQQALEILDQVIRLKTENPQGFSELPPELQAAAEYTMETGTPVAAYQTDTAMVPEERIVKNRPTLDIQHYQNVYLDPNCEGDIEKANFAILSFETSKAELKKDGRYKNLDKVNWSSQTPLHQPEHASSTANDGMQFKDELRKRVVAYEYWGFYDVTGQGKLTPFVSTWIGNVMIRMEENPFPDEKLPLVVVPYLPVNRSLMGEPDAELLEENQAILGAVMRGMIDLMARSANGQTGHAKGMLDAVNKRRYDRGEDYEFNPSNLPQQGIYQHTYPEIPASALNMLQLQNNEAEALTGVKAFSGGMSGEAYGEVAAGIRGLLDAASKREMSILRRLAQGMEQIGRKIIAMNAVFLSEEEVIQITNEEFVTVKREDLVGEFNLKVDIATAEVDEAKAQDLGFMLQTLGNTVPFEITKKILSEIARLKRMPALAHAIEEFEPQVDPLEAKKKELEIAKLESELAEIRADTALKQAKARATLSEADLKDLDFLEQETGTKHARDMQKQRAQSEENQELEIVKGLVNPRKEGESDKMSDIRDAVAYHEYSSA